MKISKNQKAAFLILSQLTLFQNVGFAFETITCDDGAAQIQSVTLYPEVPEFKWLRITINDPNIVDYFALQGVPISDDHKIKITEIFSFVDKLPFSQPHFGTSRNGRSFKAAVEQQNGGIKVYFKEDSTYRSYCKLNDQKVVFADGSVLCSYDYQGQKGTYPVLYELVSEGAEIGNWFFNSCSKY